MRTSLHPAAQASLYRIKSHIKLPSGVSQTWMNNDRPSLPDYSQPGAYQPIVARWILRFQMAKWFADVKSDLTLFERKKKISFSLFFLHVVLINHRPLPFCSFIYTIQNTLKTLKKPIKIGIICYTIPATQSNKMARTHGHSCQIHIELLLHYLFISLSFEIYHCVSTISLACHWIDTRVMKQ